MAKSKNRKQGAEQNRSSAAEQTSEQSKSTMTEDRSAVQSQIQGSPADVARKHQRRFGHN